MASSGDGSRMGSPQLSEPVTIWRTSQGRLVPDGTTRRSEPLSRRLLLLVLAIVAPLTVFRAATLWMEYVAGHEQAEARLIEQAQSMARLVDLEFDRAEGVALGLAASTALAHGNLGAFDTELRSAGDRLSAVTQIGDAKPKLSLFDVSGRRQLYTSWAPGERPIGSFGLPYVQAAIASGQTWISDLITTPSDPPCAAVAVPVLARDADGHVSVTGVVAVTVARERLLDMVAKASLLPGAAASVQDRLGITVARSFHDAETVGNPPAPAVLRAILEAKDGLAPRGTQTLDGVPSTIAFAHAPHSGYIVKLEVPEEVFLAPLRASLLQTAAIGITAIAIALLLGLLLTRRIVASFGRVPEVVASALAGNTPPTSVGLREADELASTLAAILVERERVATDARALFENSPIAVVFGDTGGRVQAANNAFLELAGRNRDELDAGSIRWDEMTPQEWIASDEAAIAEAVAVGCCKPYEKEYQRPDGSRVPVLVSFCFVDRTVGTVAAFIVDLSERRQAEEALRHSDAFARSILAGTSDCVVVLDADYRIEFMNEPGRCQKEIDNLEQVLGRRVDELWPPEAVPRVLAALTQARAGAPARYVAFGPTAKGTPKWWDVTVSPLPGAPGQPLRLLSVARDVTEARRAEQAVQDSERLAREQEARLAAIYATAPVGLGFLDRNLRWLTINDRLAAMNGHSVAEHVGRRLGDVLEASLAKKLEAMLRGVIEGGEPVVNKEIRGATPDVPGVERTWLATYQPVRSSEGAIVGLSVAVLEVSGRKRAEAALAESEARFRAITDAMPQVVWSTRPDGYHDYYNRRWYELTGTTVEQAEGEGWNPAFHPEDQPRAWATWRHSLATGEPYDIEYRLRMADGTYRWMLGRALPVRDPVTGTITRWFGTCTDIEDTVAAREALARSREELETLVEERTIHLQETQARLVQAQRMEALGQLAGGIAHDFNNVLQAVQGGASLIERRPDDAAGVRRLAQLIKEAAGRGNAVTRRLLSFSRRGDLRSEPINPSHLLDGVKEILDPTLGAGIQVHVEGSAGLPLMVADRAQLETVLVNLATNARDAMVGQGVLRLQATSEAVQGTALREHPAGLVAGTYLCLSVVDNGSGMDATTLARSVEPFYTTKGPGRGTGLGLSMAKGFAEQSGGALHIESSLGQGTTVRLWFPASQVSLTPKAAPVPTEPEPRRQHATVLLVDDEALVREVVAAELETAGYEVLQAGSGVRAVELLEAGVVADLLISDLSMPDMDGVSLIQEAQRRRPGLPAILLTGFATEATELADAGAFALLRKPVAGDMLAARVAVLLDGALTANSFG